MTTPPTPIEDPQQAGCPAAPLFSETQSYDRPTPETDVFMELLEDSEIDLSLIDAKMGDMECERDYAREIAKLACELLAENNFEVNYPPMPWEEGSPENVSGQVTASGKPPPP